MKVMKRLVMVCLIAFSAFAWQQPPADKFPRMTPGEPLPDDDGKLPNGKSQRDLIIKADYKKNLDDAAKLLKLAEDLRTDLENAGAEVVSTKMIKETDDIDRLSKSIHARLTRY